MPSRSFFPNLWRRQHDSADVAEKKYEDGDSSE